MNERFKELLIQVVGPSRLHGGEFALMGDKDVEKFAELIVRECATICDTIGKEARKQWKTKYIPHDDGRADGAWQCEEAILEHFGVNDES